MQKYLTKQSDIDKILDVIKRKVLKGTHLPLIIKEIQVGYLSSLYFKDIYKYLAQNELPSKRCATHKVETLSERFILLDSLLFKLITTLGKEKALLAIPEVCADKIITLYHASLFAGHQGVIKTYLTIGDKFFIPNWMHYLRSYLKVFYICQLARNEKLPSRQLQTRIHLNYRPISRLSVDLKVMPRLQKGHCYILFVIDNSPFVPWEVRRNRRNPNRKYNKQVWYPRIHDNGPIQHIYVHIDELHIQKVRS